MLGSDAEPWSGQGNSGSVGGDQAGGGVKAALQDGLRRATQASH